MNIELDEVVAQDISFETLELAAGVTCVKFSRHSMPVVPKTKNNLNTD